MVMSKSRLILSASLFSWIALFMIYYNFFFYYYTYKPEKIKYTFPYLNEYNGTEDFLIDNPGCYIPNYSKTMYYKDYDHINTTCGERAIFIKIMPDDKIRFLIKKDIASNKIAVNCCYKFAKRSNVSGKEDSKLLYTPCMEFRNNTVTKLYQEIVTVTCKNSDKIVYEDSYMILKKLPKRLTNVRMNKNWNILIVGMDTMSRGRVYSKMPYTVNHLQQHNWLDFRGYQKVGYNTFPNLVSMLTGKKMSTVYNSCKGGMHLCNDLFIWSKFKEAGFITAYGEDYLYLPDTFSRYNGFKTPPTDHYMRPLFLTGEKRNGNIVCLKKMSSAEHILDYALDFAKSYKNDSFFGMFWLNSYSHNLENLPGLIDRKIAEFFRRLEDTGILDNTLVFFASDHGIRYGDMRILMESYYEERLPMLFAWIPFEFQKTYSEAYYNIQINQNRLVTPYNIYMTLWDILDKVTKKYYSDYVTKSEACPSSESLFESISPNRTCLDSCVDDKWCSCHDMNLVKEDDFRGKNSLQIAVFHLQNLTQTVKTAKCTTCAMLTLKSVIRNHSYTNNKKIFYVVAFRMSPGDVAYEATIQWDNDQPSVLDGIETISPYNIRGNCVINLYDRAYCVCKKLIICNKKRKL